MRKSFLLQNNGKETRIPVKNFYWMVIRSLQKGCLIKRKYSSEFSYTLCIQSRCSCTKKEKPASSRLWFGDLTRTKATICESQCLERIHFLNAIIRQELALVNDLITMEGIQQCCTKISEETAPVSDFRAGAEYRTAMAEVLIRRSLIALRKIAVG